ncbi:MAG: response regulator transcription factor [Planctomycetales bacterium]|nr:response regulator transcription factor [Planctomycetales bacterium]
MTLNRISVVLADDHTMVRESLARVLEDSGSVVVIGQANDGRELLDVVEREKPNCVVLDYSMPNLDGPRAIEKLLTRHRNLKLLVLTVHENVQYAVRALEAGAHGYMIKSAAVDELVSAIQAVFRGETYISPKVSQDVWALLRRPKRNREGLEALSGREFDALRILAQGASLQQCADEMKVSVSTVSTYRARILEKLNLDNTAELIRFALERGING